MVPEDDPGECLHRPLLLNTNSNFEALSMLNFCWSIGDLGFLLAVTTTQILPKLSSSEDERWIRVSCCGVHKKLMGMDDTNNGHIWTVRSSPMEWS
ncbi:unnamed protein product [Malus baccata var. baccata]